MSIAPLLSCWSRQSLSKREGDQRLSPRGATYLAVVSALCAPSFVPYAVTALVRITDSDALLILGMASAAVSPYSFVAALMIGFIGLVRKATWWPVRLAIVLVLLVALKIQSEFSARHSYW